MPLTDAELIDRLNQRRPPAIDTLGGHVLSVDKEAQTIKVRYEANPEFCHSKVIVQGGFLTGMVDSAMALVVLAVCGLRTRVPTLELKVSFISPGNPGYLIGTGRIIHLGKSTAFLAGELHQLTAPLDQFQSFFKFQYPSGNQSGILAQTVAGDTRRFYARSR